MKKIIMFTLIIIIGCSKKSEKKIGQDLVSQFESLEITNLRSEPMHLQGEEPLFSKVYKLTYIDNLIVIQDPEPDYLFKIISTKTGVLKKFGKRGRGPNELGGRSYDHSFDYINNRLYIRDQYKLHTYNVDSLLNNEPVPENTIEMKSYVNDSFLKSNYCNGGYLIGSMFKKRFGLFNITKETYSSKYDYEVGPLVNQVFYINHPNLNKLAFFQTKYTSLGVLTINNDDFEISEKIWSKTEDKNHSDGKMITTIPDPNPKLGFISGTASEKYIYGLYSGKLVDKKKPEESSHTDIIYVFDWKGQPIKTYKLDKKIWSVTIDDENNILYGVAYKDYEPVLLKFKL